MSGHTPGPWQAKNEYEWNEIIGNIDGPDASQFHYSHVCSVDMHDLNTPEQRANARLIAAAPDLLEACRRAHEWLQGSEAHRAAYIGEVIAKATGISP